MVTMSSMKRGLLAWLGVLGLLTGVCTAVALNWDSVSERLLEALRAREEKAGAALFRLGELMSMRAAVKEAYGVEPDMTYDKTPGGRTLNITFRDFPLPAGTAPVDHARDIAAFAIGETKKAGEIDWVTVTLRTSSGDGVAEETDAPAPFRFESNDLIHAPAWHDGRNTADR